MWTKAKIQSRTQARYNQDPAYYTDSGGEFNMTLLAENVIQEATQDDPEYEPDEDFEAPFFEAAFDLSESLDR